MIEQDTLLVALVRLVSRLPLPPPPAKRPRGRPKTYSDRLFLKALVVMVLRRLPMVHLFLEVLAQPTPEMRALRVPLAENGLRVVDETSLSRFYIVTAEKAAGSEHTVAGVRQVGS